MTFAGIQPPANARSAITVFKGTKRQAQAELTRLTGEALRGTYIVPSKAVLADFVRARVDQWGSGRQYHR